MSHNDNEERISRCSHQRIKNRKKMKTIESINIGDRRRRRLVLVEVLNDKVEEKIGKHLKFVRNWKRKLNQVQLN